MQQHHMSALQSLGAKFESTACMRADLLKVGRTLLPGRGCVLGQGTLPECLPVGREMLNALDIYTHTQTNTYTNTIRDFAHWHETYFTSF